MRLRWDLPALFGVLVALSACGESTRQTMSEHRGGAGGSSAGTSMTGGASGTSAGSAGDGMSGGRGGSAGAQGGSGGVGTLGCMERTTNHVPGTRLRPRDAVTSEGDHSWAGWHDTELDVECAFLKTPDGTWRCFPKAEAVYGAPVYADPGCSEQVVAVNGGCDTVAYVNLSEGVTSCSPGTHRVYRVGPEVAVNGTIYVGTPGACTEAPASTTATFYRLMDELDPNDFVQATEGPLPGTGRIQATGLSASDGTMQVRGWFDTEFQRECSFGVIAPPSIHCVPFRGFSTGFADASCTTEVLYTTCNPTDSAPAYAVLPSMDRCTEGRLVTVGAASPDPTYFPDGDSCFLPADSTIRGYAIGPDAPPSVLPAVTRTVVESDPGRLKPVYLVADDGGCWFDTWYDSELSARCEFQDFADESSRCVPVPEESASPFIAYLDAACTVEAPIGIVFNACPGVPLPKVAVAGGGDECAPTVRVFSTRDELTADNAPPLYSKTDAACTPFQLSPENRYLMLENERDASALVAGFPLVE